MDFVHLHAHTHYSMQSSPVFPGQLFEAASKLGMKSIAVTDYCAIFNMPELFSAAEKAGIRLIIGSEVLLLETGIHSEGRSNAASSLILLVQNETGYRNLCILLSRAARDGFVDGMPHLDRSLFREFHEGLVCLSGYSSGRIGRSLLAGAVEEARTLTGFYRDIFGSRFYLEVQRHNSHFDDELNSSTIALAEECGVEVVATNNIHYLERKDAGCYRAFFIIGEIGIDLLTAEGMGKKKQQHQHISLLDQLRRLDVPVGNPPGEGPDDRCDLNAKPHNP